ncbi:MAG TPA: TonB-dependent receptor [Bacteroidales bacterium]|nr:TonB-dependent receptor [Bacteroidales bacterium]
MKKINLSLIIFVLFFLSSFKGFLIAQEIDLIPGLDSLPSQTLAEVVITANRYGSFQIKTPEAIRVIDNKSIQKFQLRTAPEALLLTPGVFVQKTNHGGGSPFLRGLTGNQTLLLVDGIRLSNATMRYGPNQYFNTINVFGIEKIEVLRGSGSVQYGSDAIGGTIQAFSHELVTAEKPTWGSTLITRIATQGIEQSLNGGVNYSNKGVAFRAGITWRNFGDLVGGDTTGRQTPTGYEELDFDLKGKIFLSPTSDLTMAYQSVHQSDVPVFHKVVLENYAVNKMDPQKRELAYLRLNQKINAGILNSAVFTGSFQHSEEGRELLKNGSSILRTENDKVRSFAFSAEAFTSDGNGWSANTGLEVYNDLVCSRRTDRDLSTDLSVLKRGLYPDGATMTSIAAFSMHTFDLLNWNITVGARFNTFINKVKDEVIGITTLKPSALVGNLAILRKLTKTSNIFVSMNTGFRAPNIDDLGTLGIVDFRYETPNFDLKPEHSFQYQIGYKYQDRKLRGEIYVYRNELYNLIVRNRMVGDSIEGYPVYQKENVERAYIQGAETAWDVELNKSWSVGGSMTYTYGHSITKNESVRRIPPLFGRIVVEYKHKGWWINLEWQTAGKQDRLSTGDIDDNRIPSGGTPGWNIFNVNTSYEIRFYRFDLSLHNLFNQDYRFHGSGVNGYGRSAFLSVIVNI